MLKSLQSRPLVSSGVIRHANLGSVRSKYSAPGGRTVLGQQPALKKLTVGKTRPAIYYKFDCRVELSDGSTFVRRSQFPRDEWRYLTDHRNNPIWNPSRPNLKAIEADATGKMSKFQKKFEYFDVSEKKEEKKKEESAKDDDFMDLLGQNYVPVQSGGRLVTKKKGKKK